MTGGIASNTIANTVAMNARFPARPMLITMVMGYTMAMSAYDGTARPILAMLWTANENRPVCPMYSPKGNAMASAMAMDTRHRTRCSASRLGMPSLPVQLAGSPPAPIGEPVTDLPEAMAALSDDRRTVATITADARGGLRYRVRTLDGVGPTVATLHRQLLDRLAPDGAVRYVADAAEADAAVGRGDAMAAYLLPPTTPDRIREAVERGERLPQKSTYFWPKPRTGMVMMPLERDRVPARGLPDRAS